MKKILIIDDDMDMCRLLSRFLERKGYWVETAFSGAKGIAAFREGSHDLVLCDFRLGDKDGRQVLQELKAINPQVIVIIITGYSDIKMAVDVMRMGAYDYVTKPLIPDEVLKLIQQSIETNGVSSTVIQNGDRIKPAGQPVPQAEDDDFIVGISPAAAELFRQVRLVAPTNYSVVIYGESGTGKEVIARAIHAHSARNSKPFVAVDCGTLSRELAASELFGHLKGSFTGALGDKTGLYESAEGGTLFLDEICNLPLDVQTTLLRVSQERKFRKVGSTVDIPVDVRVIVASNEDLTEACRKGKFREDLYHRFNEFSFQMPALRQRKEDIPLFADFFLKKVCVELNKNIDGFEDEVHQLFLQYNWPGNLREFKNVIRRAGLLHAGGKINVNVLPWEILGSPLNNGQFVKASAEPVTPHQTTLEEIKGSATMAEYHAIMEVLRKVKYNKTKAAALLQIDRKTLYNKIKAYEDNYKAE